MKPTKEPNWRISLWFPEIEQEIVTKLKEVYDLVVYNQPVLNLVNKKTLPILDLVHFADCIIAARHVRASSFEHNLYYDLYSNNGIASFVFSILYPDINIVIVEPDGRKADFMKAVITRCNLTNLRIVISTIEKLPSESIECCFFRGNLELSKSLLMTKDKVKKNGLVFNLKSDNWKNEIVHMPSQIFSIFDTELLLDYSLPDSGPVSSIVISKRI